MSRFATLLAASLALGALTVPHMARAQLIDHGLHAGSLEVPVNKSKVVTADRTIARAMIGNDEVADVLPISNRSVYVLGKQFGTTSLTLYDSANRVIAIMDVAVGPDVDSLKKQLARLIPGQPVDAQLSNGSVLLTGMVNDPGAADRAAAIAAAFGGDKIINLISLGGSQQVMLEVRFAEVNRQLGEQIGAQAFFSNSSGLRGAIGPGAGLVNGEDVTSTVTSNDGMGNIVTSQVTAPGPSRVVLNEVTDTFGLITKAFSLGSLNIEGVLNTLERRGLAKTLAEPTLIALSGEKAAFLAGGEFPIPVRQGDSDAITVEFKPFGVSLGFTPTVLGNKVISLIIEPEVSSIDPTASVTVDGLVVPGLQTRRASTTVELRDGESFAIAGLLRRDIQTTVNQVPILGSLPIIGSLFRSSGFQKGETELLIVVTPRLVAPLRPEQVRLPTDRIADPRAVDVLIDGEGYRPKRLDPVSGALPVNPAIGNSEPTAALEPPAVAANEESGYEY